MTGIARRASMRRIATFIASGFGAGRVPRAPGTAGTLAAIPIFLAASYLSGVAYALLVVAMFFLGVVICGIAAQEMGRADPPQVVWDEIVGYLVTMFMAPVGWGWIVVGFLLFRLFDIWKPFPIRQLERRAGGGWGVMLDDVVAGVFAFLLLQLVARVIGVE